MRQPVVRTLSAMKSVKKNGLGGLGFTATIETTVNSEDQTKVSSSSQTISFVTGFGWQAAGRKTVSHVSFGRVACVRNLSTNLVHEWIPRVERQRGRTYRL